MFQVFKPLSPIRPLINVIRLATSRTRLVISLSIFLGLICSITEVLTVALLVPFINLLLSNISFSTLSSLAFNLPSNYFLLYPLALFIATLVRIASLRLNFWLGASLGNQLSTKAYHNMITQRYPYYQDVNSSSVISSLSVKSNMLVHSLNQLFQLITHLFVTIGLLVSLFIINSAISCILLVVLFSSYVLVSAFSYRSISNGSKIISANLDLQTKVIAESFGSIRDIILNKNYGYYESTYRSNDALIRYAEARNQLYTFVPRYLMEVVGLASLLLITVYMKTFNGTNSGDIIALTAAFALALQKLMPSMQNIYSSFTQILSHKEGVADFIHFIYLDPPSYSLANYKESQPILFAKEIIIHNMSFSYDSNQALFANVNLTVPKGSRVGVIGTTGAGKSTFFDLLLGLRTPTTGHIKIDHFILNESNISSYQDLISHVPQSIYLTSDSFAKNIAFGQDKPNLARIKKVCNMANISDFIESLPNTYNTSVGENGSLLSGGQRQRLAIARALYKASSILFLDEFTSALDSTTELKIIETITSLPNDITIFFIAHRSASLRACNIILECADNTIRRVK